MARKLLSDEQWREIIQTCRSSGLSDQRWCTENGGAPSTFYKYACKLRIQACKVPTEEEAVKDGAGWMTLDELKKL